MFPNEEDLEKQLSSLTIKDEDKSLFTKRKAYIKREADKNSWPGGDKKIKIKQVNDKTSRQDP